MREDTYTRDEAGAAAHAAMLGRAEDFGSDRHEHDGDRVKPLEPTVMVCRARAHNPTPDGQPNAKGCWHCPTCGGKVVKPIPFEEHYRCSRPSCSWAHGAPSEPPF